MKRLIWAVLLLAVMTLPAAAMSKDEVQNAGGKALTDAMPEESLAYMEGLRPDTVDDLAVCFSRLINNVSEDSKNVIQDAVRCLIRVAVIVLVTAAARGFSAAAADGKINNWVDMAGALGCAAVLLQDFTGVLYLCRNTLEQISVFSAALQPVLATVLSMAGGAATATTMQVSAMLVFDLVIRLINTALVPATCAYLAIVSVDAATGEDMLHGLADGVKNIVAASMKLSLTLFTAYLTIAGGISGSIDRMTLKTAKFAVSGAVPVVGGVISDATETMLSGAALLKNSIGIFGLLCITAICFIPFLRAGASYLCYKAGAAVLYPLCSGNLRNFLRGVGTGFGLLLGILSTCCMILYLELVYVVAMVKPI